MNLRIENGRIIDPANGIDAVGTLVLRNGKVEGIEKSAKSTGGKNAIDASGFIVCPGLIDMHVHLRDPGQEYKEDIETGSKAAVAGGVTAMACMANTEPVNDTPSVTEFIINKAKRVGLARVLPIAAITKGLEGKELTEFGALKASGAVAFSDDGMPTSSHIMRRALEYSSQFKMPIIDHCEDPRLSADGVMHEGAVSAELGLKGWTPLAESVIVHRNVQLALLTGGKIHMCHLTCKESMEQMAFAKKLGANATGEIMPHHLFLDDELVRTFDTRYKVNPPIRSTDHIKALKNALKKDIIDVIATDHAPHADFEKLTPFESAPFGMLGLQTMLPLALKLVEEGVLTLSQAIGKMTAAPASILGLPAGRFDAGYNGDVTIIDPKHSWKFNVEHILSKSKNSPFIGWEMAGRVVHTIVGGKKVFSL